VEALSVTPYTRRALDRGTAATFVAAVRHAVEEFSRNVDAHDVPLDGEVVERVSDRLLARAETIGGERARDYLAERLDRVKDRWREAKTGSARLGYTDGTSNKQHLVGLLRRAAGQRWDDLTVGMSMRETENEINLLVPPAGEIFNPIYGAPEWSFEPPSAEPTEEDVAEPTEEELPDGDELGESTLGEVR